MLAIGKRVVKNHYFLQISVQIKCKSFSHKYPLWQHLKSLWIPGVSAPVADADNSPFLLPLFKLDGVRKQDEIKIIHLRLKTINKHLKKLGTACGLTMPLTTYVARYS